MTVGSAPRSNIDHYWIRGPWVVLELGIERGCLEIKNGKIIQIAQKIPANISANILIKEYSPELYLIPGMIDLHIHGSLGFDVMDGTPEALKIISQNLIKTGTTAYLATTMTESVSTIEKALINIGDYRVNQIPEWGAEILGAHLEGPFISPSRMGAQNPGFIHKPDINLFKHWQVISNQSIRLVTLAPEVEGALELVKYLSETGVVASVGHSDASFAQAKKSMDCGVTHCTHLYNAMSSFHHRTPGVALAVLEDSRVRAELIADGIHVDPAVISFTLKTKGAAGLVLVTDAMRAQCLKDGAYDLGGQKVDVKNGAARLSEGKSAGALAGSVLKLNEAFANIQKFSGCGILAAVKMCCENPAKQLGVFNQKGSININKDADLVVLDAKANVLATICRGLELYQVKTEE